MGDSRVTAALCDGGGTCNPGMLKGCGKFTCDPSNGTCFAKCTTDAQCAQGKKCNATTGKCN